MKDQRIVDKISVYDSNYILLKRLEFHVRDIARGGRGERRGVRASKNEYCSKVKKICQNIMLIYQIYVPTNMTQIQICNKARDNVFFILVVFV